MSRMQMSISVISSAIRSLYILFSVSSVSLWLIFSCYANTPCRNQRRSAQPAEDPQVAARFGGDAVVIAPHRRPAPPQRFDSLRPRVVHDPLAAILEPHKLRRPVGRDADHFQRLRLRDKAAADAVEDKETGRGGDKENSIAALSPCLPFSLSPCSFAPRHRHPPHRPLRHRARAQLGSQHLLVAQPAAEPVDQQRELMRVARPAVGEQFALPLAQPARRRPRAVPRGPLPPPASPFPGAGRSAPSVAAHWPRVATTRSAAARCGRPCISTNT